MILKQESLNLFYKLDQLFFLFAKRNLFVLFLAQFFSNTLDFVSDLHFFFGQFFLEVYL